MEVHARINEADIGAIRVGQSVTFTVDAFPDVPFSGKVELLRKSPQQVQNVVTYTVVISAANTDLLLLPGMTATVEILVSKSGEVLKIPTAALRYTPQNPAAQISLQTRQNESSEGEGRPGVVWKIGSAGTPLPVSVSVGESDGETSVVTAGSIEAGDELIINEILTTGGQRLFGLRFGF